MPSELLYHLGFYVIWALCCLGFYAIGGLLRPIWSLRLVRPREHTGNPVSCLGIDATWGPHLRPISGTGLAFYVIWGLSRPICSISFGGRPGSEPQLLFVEDLVWVLTFGFVLSICNLFCICLCCFTLLLLCLCLKQKWEALWLYHLRVLCVICWLIGQLINQWHENGVLLE